MTITRQSIEWHQPITNPASKKTKKRERTLDMVMDLILNKPEFAEFVAAKICIAEPLRVFRGKSHRKIFILQSLDLLQPPPPSLPPTSSGRIRKPTRNEASQQEQAALAAAAKTAERERKEAAKVRRAGEKLRAEEEKRAKATAKKEQRRAGRKTGNSQFDAIELD
ncbi:MAG: hypothetical protein Q9187_001423 [Circinaria calcarea]